MCEDGHYHDNLDIARLNKRDGEGDIFPYDKWQLIMRSDDSEPPHFHIIRDGWDVIFSIDKFYTMLSNRDAARRMWFQLHD